METSQESIEYHDAEKDNTVFESISGKDADPKDMDDLSNVHPTEIRAEDITSMNSIYNYRDDNWRLQKKHVFILSNAGKPIFSLHGEPNKLADLIGSVQALVSYVEHGQDVLNHIQVRGLKIVFLVCGSLILVAISRTNMSVIQLQMQLRDIYNQIVTIFTSSFITKTFEKQSNFDLRVQLKGNERFIKHLLLNDSNETVTNSIFTSITNSIYVFPLPTTVRSHIVSAIQSNCSKIKNLVFAILMANNKLIALVRNKDCTIHPTDLRIIFNMIDCSESLKKIENWMPFCLPKFDKDHYLYWHVSYLTENCQACLLLVTTERDTTDFHALSNAKHRITEKMQKLHCLDAISKRMTNHANFTPTLTSIGAPELRHFIYKPKSIAQLLCSELLPPYTEYKEFERLTGIYRELLHRVHNMRPLKLIYEVREREVILAWVTTAYELYAVFEPMVDKSVVIKNVDKLIKWIEKEYDLYFIRSHPTF